MKRLTRGKEIYSEELNKIVGISYLSYPLSSAEMGVFLVGASFYSEFCLNLNKGRFQFSPFQRFRTSSGFNDINMLKFQQIMADF